MRTRRTRRTREIIAVRIYGAKGGMILKTENRRTFRLSDEDMEKLGTIAKHLFGTSEKMKAATLKILIEKEYKLIKAGS